MRFQAPRNEEGAATHLLPAPGTILFPLPGRAGEQSWLAAWTRAPAARASPAARPPPRNGDGPPGWGLSGVLCGRRGAASRGSPLPFRAVKAGMVDPHCTSGREPGGPGEVSRGGASHRAGRSASRTDWLGALWRLGKARGLGLGRTWSGTDLLTAPCFRMGPPGPQAECVRVRVQVCACVCTRVRSVYVRVCMHVCVLGWGGEPMRKTQMRKYFLKKLK